MDQRTLDTRAGYDRVASARCVTWAAGRVTSPATYTTGANVLGIDLSPAMVERAPYPDVEHPSRRAYLLARKPV